MAALRLRSSLVPLAILLVGAALICAFERPETFVPAARKLPVAKPVNAATLPAQAAILAMTTLGGSLPAMAVPEEDEGFDARILAVLALPLLAISWAGFNVWRVFFRQVGRIQDNRSGSSRTGLDD